MVAAWTPGPRSQQLPMLCDVSKPCRPVARQNLLVYFSGCRFRNCMRTAHEPSDWIGCVRAGKDWDVILVCLTITTMQGFCEGFCPDGCSWTCWASRCRFDGISRAPLCVDAAVWVSFVCGGPTVRVCVPRTVCYQICTELALCLLTPCAPAINQLLGGGTGNHVCRWGWSVLVGP